MQHGARAQEEWLFRVLSFIQTFRQASNARQYL